MENRDFLGVLICSIFFSLSLNAMTLNFTDEKVERIGSSMVDDFESDVIELFGDDVDTVSHSDGVQISFKNSHQVNFIGHLLCRPEPMDPIFNLTIDNVGGRRMAYTIPDMKTCKKVLDRLSSSPVFSEQPLVLKLNRHDRTITFSMPEKDLGAGLTLAERLAAARERVRTSATIINGAAIVDLKELLKLLRNFRLVPKETSMFASSMKNRTPLANSICKSMGYGVASDTGDYALALQKTMVVEDMTYNKVYFSLFNEKGRKVPLCHDELFKTNMNGAYNWYSVCNGTTEVFDNYSHLVTLSCRIK